MRQEPCVLQKYLKASNYFINRILNTVFLPYKLTQVRHKRNYWAFRETHHSHTHTHTYTHTHTHIIERSEIDQLKTNVYITEFFNVSRNHGGIINLKKSQFIEKNVEPPKKL